VKSAKLGGAAKREKGMVLRAAFKQEPFAIERTAARLTSRYRSPSPPQSPLRGGRSSMLVARSPPMLDSPRRYVTSSR
jgi:hypothetical protein